MPPQSKPGGAKDRQWTVMVFMGAATIAGNTPLIKAAEDDLAEMRFVGSGGALHVFVQVHQGRDIPPRRARVNQTTPTRIDDLAFVPEAQADPAEGHALESFITWALSEARHNPENPDHYSMLVLWGHAYDFAIGREQTKEGTIDALDFVELSGVLQRLQARFGATKSKLDILGFDACDLATVEMACQLEPFAKYLLGSQIGVPIPGWPYDRILDRLRTPFGELMRPSELGSYVVRRFCESYTPESRTVSLTLLDLNRTQELIAVTGVLALTLATTIGDAVARDRIAYLFSQSQTAAGRPYVDVPDLCLNLVRHCDDLFVVEAARALGDFLISPQPLLVGEGTPEIGQPFVVEHGRNTGQTARLNGLSIYAPHVAPRRDFDGVRRLYQNFVFAQETQWSGLVHTLARPS
jgi:hypothetical protein